MSTPIFKFAVREDLKDCGIDFLPSRAEPFATGWDVRAAFPNRKSVTIRAGEYIKIPLGFRAFCPEGWWYELKPRSSTFAKKYLHCLYGTIDQCFENQLLLAGQYLPNVPLDEFGQIITSLYKPDPEMTLTIEFGEAIGQIIPVRRKDMEVVSISNEEYDSLCKSRGAARGTGGFGSTDKPADKK